MSDFKRKKKANKIILLFTKFDTWPHLIQCPKIIQYEINGFNTMHILGDWQKGSREIFLETGLEKLEITIVLFFFLSE